MDHGNFASVRGLGNLNDGSVDAITAVHHGSHFGNNAGERGSIEEAGGLLLQDSGILCRGGVEATSGRLLVIVS